MHVLIAGTFAILGALLASFTGVVSERIHTGHPWSSGRSKCNSCRKELGGADMVPVFSWVCWRGRCRQCGSRVPLRYPLQEAILGFIYALSYLTLGFTLPLFIFLAAVTVLFFIVLYDLRHMIVPPQASALLFILSLLFLITTSGGGYLLGTSLVRAGAIALFFFVLHVGSKGRAMGLGDAPVALSLSLLVGVHALSGLLLSFWVGAVIGIGILVLRRGGPTMGIEVPFVPFMAVGFLLAFFTQWNLFPY